MTLYLGKQLRLAFIFIVIQTFSYEDFNRLKNLTTNYICIPIMHADHKHSFLIKKLRCKDIQCAQIM
jgi:hypothetical protein